MKRLLVTLAFVLLSLPGFAWGWPHRLIAYIGQERCTPATRAVLDRYLDLPLNNVALWTDHFRARPWAPADYSDAPNYTFQALEHAVSVDEKFRPLEHSNRPDGNGEGYGAYLRYYKTLEDYKNQTDSAVVVALKMIVHLIGDMHCPGHILYSFSKDKYDPMGGGIAGGYGIWQHKYKGKKTTLHALLDGAERIKPELKSNLAEYAAFLDKRFAPIEKESVRGTMADFIQDAARRSKVIYTWVTPGQEVDDTFYTEPSHEEVLAYLLAVSGYRTAHILNTLFDPDYKGL